MHVPEDYSLPWACRIVEYEETECWLWVGSMYTNGYGSLWYQDRLQPAHRVMKKEVYQQ